MTAAVAPMDNLARVWLTGSTGACADRPQFVQGDMSFRRSQLDAAVRAVASVLEQRCACGTHVLIAMDDGISLVIVFLAAIAAGMVPAMIHPRLPAAELADIEADYSATLTLQGDTAMAWVAQAARDGDPAWDNWHLTPGGRPCFAQYTSGSTGKPKGVLHTRDATLAVCERLAAHFDITARDRIYAVPRMFFGYGMGASLLLPLHTGAQAVLDPAWPTPASILANLRAWRPSIWFAVPAIYRALRPHAAEIGTWLQRGISAGSPLPAAECAAWAAAGVNVCDGIGATETLHIFLANDPTRPVPGVTGSPLPGIQVRLTTDDGELVTGPDTTGLLWVRGAGIAGAYWNRETTSRERFVDGWYRTGDLFSIDPSGHYRGHGREDERFKVKGRWVAALAVEGWVTEAMGDIAEAALVPSCLRHDSSRPTFFYAVASGADDIDPDSDRARSGAITEAVAARFPAHMVPSRIVRLPSLPRNANGKLLRARLTEHADQLHQLKR